MNATALRCSTKFYVKFLVAVAIFVVSMGILILCQVLEWKGN